MTPADTDADPDPDPDQNPNPDADSGDAFEVETVLVPVDGSEASTTAVDHASAIAARYGAGVHALYVLPGPTAREIREGKADQDAVATDASEFLDGIRDACERRSIPVSCSTAVGFSTGRLTRHPGSVILDCADEVDADFLVIPREPAVDAPDVLEKAAEYVLSYASQPVLSV